MKKSGKVIVHNRELLRAARNGRTSTLRVATRVSAPAQPECPTQPERPTQPDRPTQPERPLGNKLPVSTTHFEAQMRRSRRPPQQPRAGKQGANRGANHDATRNLREAVDPTKGAAAVAGEAGVGEVDVNKGVAWISFRRAKYGTWSTGIFPISEKENDVLLPHES